MPQPPRAVPNTHYLSLVTVDPTLPVPLYRQIYRGLRDAITSGQLVAGTRLPSTRDLAAIWGVSRNTLRNAFDRLLAEGYLEALVGRGTFVAAQAVTEQAAVVSVMNEERIRPISTLGQILEPIGRNAPKTAVPHLPFTAGIPDYAAFPHKIWNRIVNRCQRRLSQGESQVLPVNGIRKLREAIASYLVSARGYAVRQNKSTLSQAHQAVCISLRSHCSMQVIRCGWKTLAILVPPAHCVFQNRACACSGR